MFCNQTLIGVIYCSFYSDYMYLITLVAGFFYCSDSHSVAVFIVFFSHVCIFNMLMSKAEMIFKAAEVGGTHPLVTMTTMSFN